MSVSRVPPDLAGELLDKARKAATRIGVDMSFAIVDAAGYLTDFTRMQAAGWVTVDLARGKARAAAAYGRTTQELAEQWGSATLFTTALIAQHDGDLVPAAGGHPITIGGDLAGAIGASGGTGQQDHQVLAEALAGRTQ